MIIPLHAAESGWANKEFSTPPTHVNPEAIVVEGTTEIKWLPEPFVFHAGKSLRYIDYKQGDDANDGSSKTTPWKHHPWDPQAEGNAAAEKGIHSYVFKGGVTYRGNLVGAESGTAEEPIRLTRDPDWGKGPALLAGSVLTSDWQALSDDQARAAGIPEASFGKVWVSTLSGDFIPRAGWVLNADGSREWVPLARWPNWEIEHPYNHFTQWFRVDGGETERKDRFPRTKVYAEVLKGFEPDAFDGATVWMNHVSEGGNIAIIGPFPSTAHKYNPEEGSVEIALTHPSRFPQKQSPFYLENLPRFLDQDGEWTFVPEGRKLYLRLPSDKNPNETPFEVARHPVILDLVDTRYVEVSGLDFTGGNAADLNRAARGGEKSNEFYARPEYYSVMPAIRLTGEVRDTTLRNLRIYKTAGLGIANNIQREGDLNDGVLISDNELFEIDNGGINFRHQVGPVGFPNGRITDLKIFRNRLEEIGLRCSVPQGGRGINASDAEGAEIAGNVIRRTGAMGINVIGTRGPFTRLLVHHNQVSEGLMQKNDFGNIEFWGHGPAYIYNNVSIDPVGFFANLGSYHKAEAFYFDHGYKGFLFNNIGWSRTLEDARHGVMGQSFFKEVRNRWNQGFHNTAYNFQVMQAMEGVGGEQQHYLANLFIQRHPSTKFFDHWGLNDSREIGYARNVLAGAHGNIFARDKGTTFATVEDFQTHIEGLENHITTDVTAWITPGMPVMDPDGRDFRLTDTSAAIDRGVKVFVPWGLYGNVGEWFFRLHPKNPNTVLAYDLYNQPNFGFDPRTDATPRNDLLGEGFTSGDYIPGVLEDWNRGALQFDGTKTLRISNGDLVKEITTQPRRGGTPEVVDGRDRKTVRMDTNNFLIEVVFRGSPQEKGSVIVMKINDQGGYAFGINQLGQLTLSLKGQDGSVSIHTANAIPDENLWHHVLAEVDRKNSQVTVYLNGSSLELTKQGDMPAPDVSLDNEADFLVGPGFVGALDYLRVCRGTLADANTSIEELMGWQFNGPQTRDFLGRSPVGSSRDAGALEHPSVAGRQEIPEMPEGGATITVDQYTRLLEGPWKAKLFTELPAAPKPQQAPVDPGISDAAAKAVQSNFDVADWEAYDPGTAQMWKGFEEVDGEAVFRKTFEVPEEWQGKDLTLSLGPIDDFDDVYWNGQLVGRTTIETPAFWQHERFYTIPGKLVEAGLAVIAIRVFDRYGSGGMSSFPNERYLRLKDAPKAGELIEGEDGWLSGSSRQVKALNWGSVSAPRAAKPGEEIKLQISFGVETFQTTRGDILYFVQIFTADGETKLLQAGPEKVIPMDTKPYTLKVEMPKVEDAKALKAVLLVSPNEDADSPMVSAEVDIEITPDAP